MPLYKSIPSKKRNGVIESEDSHTAPPDTSPIKSVKYYSWETEKTCMCQKKKTLKKGEKRMEGNRKKKEID